MLGAMDKRVSEEVRKRAVVRHTDVPERVLSILGHQSLKYLAS
jgi:hypothetical protein